MSNTGLISSLLAETPAALVAKLRATMLVVARVYRLHGYALELQARQDGGVGQATWAGGQAGPEAACRGRRWPHAFSGRTCCGRLACLRVLWLLDESLQTLPSPIAAPGRWLVETRDAPRSFRHRLLKAASCFSGDPPGKVAQVAVAEHPCSQCASVCPRRDMLLSHASRVHGYRNPAASRVVGSICAACGTNFHTTARLYKHVSNGSTQCIQYYIAHMPVLEPDVLAAKSIRVAAADENKSLQRPAQRCS